MSTDRFTYAATFWTYTFWRGLDDQTFHQLQSVVKEGLRAELFL
jgi:hypothetical protein